MSQDSKLRIRLFGPFEAAWQDGTRIDLRSAKVQALIALLATASEGKRTRSWLQEVLWDRAGQEHGRASLRQALRAVRAALGRRFDQVFTVSNDAVRLNPDAVIICGDRTDGDFLEGIDVREDRFRDWLRQQRTRTGPPVDARTPDLPPERIFPRLAVIPFAVLPAGAGDGALGDAVAQEVTRALSGSSVLSVISHLSCRAPDARTASLADLTRALGADYFVWGNIRVSGDRMRIAADLLDAATGEVLWASSYSQSLAAFLRGDAESVSDLAGQIGRSILRAAVDTATSRPLPEIESHRLLMSGISMMHYQSAESFERARSHIQEVARRAPTHSFTHAWLAKWHILRVQQGWSGDISADTAAARDCTSRALDLNPECAFSLAIDGFVRNNLMKRPDEAGARFDEALSIDPNNALAWLLKGALRAFVDDGSTAVECTDRARELSPLDPYGYFFDSLSATARAAAGDYAGALAFADRSLSANRRHSSTLRVRTGALQLLGRHEEARAAAIELLGVEPGLTVRKYLATHPAADFEIGKRWASALEQAGVPRG